MVDAKKCDLCEKYFDRLNRKEAWIERHGAETFHIRDWAGHIIDLCDECADAFQKFINERTSGNERDKN